MAKLNLDLSQVKEFDLLPKGKYPAMVEEVELRESQAGNPMLFWKFVFTEGELEGRPQTMFTSLSVKALFRLKPVFKALGVTIPEGGNIELETDDDTGQLMSPMVIGTPCILQLGIGVVDGGKRNQVDAVLPMFDESGQSKLPMNESTNGRNIQ